jgi:acetolactate synthase-1/2/3 large subunit
VTKATCGLDDVGAALRLAVEAPARPVFVEVPTDRLSSAAGPGRATDDAEPYATATAGAHGPRTTDRSAARIEDGDLEVVCAALARASRPLLWVGGGAVASGAGEAVKALAERLEAPILTTYSARGIAGRHRLDVGLPPHLPAVGELWETADVVLAIGSDLDGMSTMNWRLPRPARLIAVNVDTTDAAKNYEPSLVLEADAREACEALADALSPGATPWVDVGALRADVLARLRAQHPEELAFLDAFTSAVPEDVVVASDMCIPGYWLAALHRPVAPRHFQYPMGWGTLGYAFPAALGAAVHHRVVSVSGDGGFLFACGELATAQQEHLPLTAVVVDDGGYGMLRYDQRHAGTPPYGVDLATPDFVKLAEAFGMGAQAVDGLGDAFAGALAEHAADPKPTVLVARAALTPPPTTSPRWHRTGPPVWSLPT